MLMSKFEDVPATSRELWPLVPLERVGPLRFGMTMQEAATAVAPVSEIRRFQASARRSDVVGIELGFLAEEPLLYAYFDSGRLFCVACDAARGPLITLDGAALNSRTRAELYQWLANISYSLAYGPAGNPGIEELGLVLRAQTSADQLLSRAVVVGRAWAERCVDDWEGSIPTCEWVGSTWHGSIRPDTYKVWEGGWSPPF